MKIAFTKFTACGNDFILMDNRKGVFSREAAKEITPCLCERRSGIGADGVVLLENSNQADYRMRIFNADGSEAEMCGNGARCLMKYLNQLEGGKNSYSIETLGGNIVLSKDKDQVCVSMPTPKDISWSIRLEVKGNPQTVHHLDTGVPHLVMFVNDLNSAEWMEMAPLMRAHPMFHPSGANVNFVKVLDEKRISVRTYERGVEAETPACGTGAVASALAAAKVYGLKGPITALPRSNDPLAISFSFQAEGYANVTLKGSVSEVFQGTLDLNLIRNP